MSVCMYASVFCVAGGVPGEGPCGDPARVLRASAELRATVLG